MTNGSCQNQRSKNPSHNLHYPTFIPRFSGGLTNQELNQGAAVEFEQNRTQEQVLPTIDSLHNAVTNSFYFPGVNY
jgi:hypothetical protein